MFKPANICCLVGLLLLFGLALSAPPQNRTNKVVEDYEDEDDLIQQFLDGIKPELPQLNITNSSLVDASPNLILISFDGFRWDYLENHTLPNITKYS